MSTAVVENKLYEMIMSLSLPASTLISLGKKLSEAAVSTIPATKTSRREDILNKCCGAWADDKRTTEEILCDIRSAFNHEIIKDIQSE